MKVKLQPFDVPVSRRTVNHNNLVSMEGEQEKTRFDKTVTLEDIRARVERFARERDWDQVPAPSQKRFTVITFEHLVLPFIRS